MKILIVDDEKIILEKLKMYISQIFTEKENIFTSDNAAKALEIISSQQPDIILTDIRMPGKDGLYISSFVHNNFPDKIVILITGFSDFKYAQTAIKNHVFDYILKPVDENVLKESVLKAIHTITERKNQAIMRKKYESYLKENIRNLQKDFFERLLFRNTTSLSSSFHEEVTMLRLDHIKSYYLLYCKCSTTVSKDLEKEYYRLQFLVDEGNTNLQREMEVSIAAGEIVGLLYDALAKQYVDPTTERAMKSLNILCVRMVFCLYAEDAGIFGQHGMFHDYLEEFDARKMRKAMIELFQILDTKPEDRDPYLKDDNPQLAAFPYVNGGLFANEDIEIPPFTDEIRNLLLEKASADFDWSEISPTIFGAVFESTLNPETRRSGGMHYTSIENIHKVIDPLFLDDLKNELKEIQQITVQRTKDKKLRDFQTKLSNLRWLDPASGSGNFLTETYISIRRLENEVIKELQRGQITFGFDESSPIHVSIDQFYGIEINDFAVTVAKTALWIAESQMMKETEDIVHMNLDFLPLTTNAFIVEGNALELDWESVVSKYEVSYIMGNPPFVGARLMEQGSVQKKEVQNIFGKIKDVQDLDYVTCWYKLAAAYIQNTRIQVCFVSTNSICQGSQVPILWNVLYKDYSIHINFAYQTFKWSSESSTQAAVHCVIVGFAQFNRNEKRLFSTEATSKIVSNISPYLVEGSDTFVVAMKESLDGMPKMSFGNQPRDGGNFVIKEEEYQEIMRKEPELKKWIHPYIGADEFIKGKKRWCLWLKHVSSKEIVRSKILSEKVERVRQFRLSSKAKTTNGYAKVPQLFAQITQPDDVDFLIIPRVSSERRRYVPIGFATKDIISSDAVQIVPNATLYHFGVLTSNVHMAWMRAVCGRLKSDYRYSKEIVYNTFPWPKPTEEQRIKIEQTAQVILNAREQYSDCSLADMYGEKMYLFPELVKAHQDNDRAVMQAYGFTKGSEAYKSEAACVAELMKLYQKKVEELEKR